jgi:hypothetical protein
MRTPCILERPIRFRSIFRLKETNLLSMLEMLADKRRVTKSVPTALHFGIFI